MHAMHFLPSFLSSSSISISSSLLHHITTAPRTTTRSRISNGRSWFRCFVIQGVRCRGKFIVEVVCLLGSLGVVFECCYESLMVAMSASDAVLYMSVFWNEFALVLLCFTRLSSLLYLVLCHSLLCCECKCESQFHRISNISV